MLVLHKDAIVFERYLNGMTATRPQGSYRALWWIDHGEPQTLPPMASSASGSWIDPANQIVIVNLGSHPVGSNGFTDEAHQMVFAAIRQALTAR
jgi:CubicO group peptidase (beta-lactamase class C family)